MKIKILVKSAFKELNKYKLRTFFMMIGIVIGITALTLIISVGIGAQDRVMDRVKKFGLESLMVFAGGSQEMTGARTGEEVATLKLNDAELIKQEIPGIVDAAPFNRKRENEVIFGNVSTTAPIFGVTPSWLPVWEWKMRDGEFIDDRDMATYERTAVIGATVRKELFGDGNPIGEQIRVGNVPFTIKGVLEEIGTSPGGGDMDNRVLIPLSTFMRRVANVDHIAGIKIRLTSSQDIDNTVESITSILREQHRLSPGVPDDFRIVTPDEIIVMAEKVAGTFNILLAIVAGISLITGGIVIANIMLISVNERRKEIGLRKAVGARSKDITTQFLSEAVTIAVTGGILGIVLGFAGAIILEAITSIPVSISWETLAIGVLFSSLVGILAGLQPAKRAALLNPVESLRS